MPRTTIIVEPGSPERPLVNAWLQHWRGRLAFVSDDEG
jgi:hypothetical protein